MYWFDSAVLLVCKLYLNFSLWDIWLLLCENSTHLTKKPCSWFSQTNTRADKTVCKDIALQRARRDERSNNIVTYCVMLFDGSSWSLKHSSTNTTYNHLAREYWVSSSELWNASPCKYVETAQTKRWDIYYNEPTRLKTLPLPHSIKAHTACVHTECTERVTYVRKLQLLMSVCLI